MSDLFSRALPDSGEPPDFLSELSPSERLYVSNLAPAVYDMVMREKSGGQRIITIEQDAEAGLAPLRKVSLSDLKRLKLSIQEVTRGHASYRSGNLGGFEDAAIIYANATELNPFNEIAMRSCGVALASAGYLNEALQWMEKAVELNPGNTDAQRQLELIRKEYKQATGQPATITPAPLKRMAKDLPVGRLRFSFLHGLASAGTLLALAAIIAWLVTANQIAGHKATLGFDSDDVVVLQLLHSPEQHPEAAGSPLGRLMQLLEGQTHGKDICLSSRLPLFDEPAMTDCEIAGASTASPIKGQTSLNCVSEEYFRVLRIPLRAGRCFSEKDRGASIRPVLINEAFARRFWEGRDPLGREISLAGEKTPRTVIGCVGDVVESASQPVAPQVYIPIHEWTAEQLSLRIALRGNEDPRQLWHSLNASRLGFIASQPSDLAAALKRQWRSLHLFRLLWIAATFLGAATALASYAGLSIKHKRRRRSLQAPLIECPSCLHLFVPSRVRLVDQNTIRRFGGIPVTCPMCQHTWGRNG